MAKKIAIIGGTGLENPDILKEKKECTVSTPYGDTSSTFVTGKINGTEVAILSRHGRQHTIPPTQVNNRANIWAIREIGCTQILATTACGSLKEEIDRGHLVVLDQFIDFTRHRKISFFEHFEPGEMKHTPMAEPFDSNMRKNLLACASQLGLKTHAKGTVVTIEGPRFSSRAESQMFKSWGGDVINMSTAPEVILANEIGMPYAAVAISTDYDCWKEGEASVTWEDVVEVFHQNVDNVINLIKKAVPLI